VDTDRHPTGEPLMTGSGTLFIYHSTIDRAMSSTLSKLEKTIDHYEKRKTACENAGKTVEAGIASIPKTKKGIIDFLVNNGYKPKGLASKSKPELVEKAKNHWSMIEMESQTRGKHYDKQIAVIREAIQKGVPSKVKGFTGGNVEPVVDYNMYPMNSLVFFNDKKNAKFVASKIKKQRSVTISGFISIVFILSVHELL
jgi:mannosyltransferase OCH1-like enzyme